MSTASLPFNLTRAAELYPTWPCAINASAAGANTVVAGVPGKRIVVLETPDGLVVVKRPTITKFKGFQDTETKTLDVQEGLVRDCLLYPDQRAWNALVDAQPGIVMRAANAVVFLAGVRVNDNLPGK